MTDQRAFESVFRSGLLAWIDLLEASATTGRNLLNSSSMGSFTVMHVQAGQSITQNFPRDGLDAQAIQLSGNFVGPGGATLAADDEVVKVADTGGADLHSITVSPPADAKPGAYVGSVKELGGSTLRTFRVIVV